MQKDTVVFNGRQVTSKELSKVGYTSGNYSLRVQEDGTAVWETMHMKAGEGMAFWRGEVKGEEMRGTLNRQFTEGESKDYAFSGSLTEKREPQEDAVPDSAPPTEEPLSEDPDTTT